MLLSGIALLNRQVRAHVELKRIPNRRINLVRLVRYLEPLRGGRN
jgi:hypothetical protein